MTLTTLSPPASQIDPRAYTGETALALASRNSFPVVAGQRAKRDRGGLLIGVGAAVLLGGVTFFGLNSARQDQPQRAAPAAQPATTAAPPVAVVPQQVVASPAPVVASTPAPVVVDPGPSPEAQRMAAAAQATERARSPTLLVDTTTPPGLSATPPGEGAAVVAAAPARSVEGLTPDEAFGARVGSAGADTASASRMADPSQTVAQGTLISAVLETAIDSDLPGYVRAMVTTDVRSFDGSRVLIPRSSRLIGQYRNGLQSGQTRAYVVWQRLLRPDGVSVALASPAVDSAGRAGLTGEVDTHFWDRFGSAMLLSVIGAAGRIGGSGLIITDGQSPATVAAQRDGQIPPTVRVRQGQPIRVFTARDLDFSTTAGRA